MTTRSNYRSPALAPRGHRARAAAHERHDEASALLDAPVEQAFAFLDDWVLGWRVSVEADARSGRMVGSHVTTRGSMIGVTLELEEVVVQREPPLRKAWEALRVPLAVIERYRVGFELTPHGGSCTLRVFMDYELPDGEQRWLGRLLGPFCARRYVRRMAEDASRYFTGRHAL